MCYPFVAYYGLLDISVKETERGYIRRHGSYRKGEAEIAKEMLANTLADWLWSEVVVVVFVTTFKLTGH